MSDIKFIEGGIFYFVQCINDFFKLFSLNLHTVSVHNHPASVEIFLCQLTQFLFPDTEVF